MIKKRKQRQDALYVTLKSHLLDQKTDFSDIYEFTSQCEVPLGFLLWVNLASQLERHIKSYDPE